MPGKLQTVFDSIAREWPEIDNDRTIFSIAVQHVAARLGRIARDALKPFDLAFTEFEVLCALRSAGPDRHVLPSDLYQRLVISSGGLTKILKSLEARGLISRPETVGDARRKPAAITPAGWDLVEGAMAAVQLTEKSLLEDPGPPEGVIADLNRKLMSVSDCIEKKISDT